MSDAVARINDETLQAPEDLYIPPRALRVMLERFEGPLDLLLWLIRKNRFDILDIPIADIARQYDRYIELMQALDIELAAEYLFMAAWLAEIKSRMLLPKPDLGELAPAEEDPRAELMQRLLQYEGYRQAAQWLDSLNRTGRDIWPAQAWLEAFEAQKPDLTLSALLSALGQVALRQQWYQAHKLAVENIELDDKLHLLKRTLPLQQPVAFETLLDPQEGRLGVVVTFMALLELARQKVIQVQQDSPFSSLTLVRIA
ncbi:MAG TPA: segregation/condensation protein A [Piscirickettsiaceae bacterium]|nr:segregation/condensation protein A [Piscirickettsiaceae bacterium]HIQ39883.1 segregation/condensation protein A [Sulfurivirga caldicuralii]